MAASHRTARLTLVAWVLLSWLASAQIRFLTLEQAETRTGPGLTPAYEGDDVAVVGQVVARPLWTGDIYLTPIEDNAGYGLFLAGSALQVQGLGPGDWVQTRGIVGVRTGMPVLNLRDLQKFQTLPVPAPRSIAIADAASPRDIGVLVMVEGIVVRTGSESFGDTLVLRQPPDQIDIVLPTPLQNSAHPLKGFSRGDRIRATGVVEQSCPQPPFNCGYRILVEDGAATTLLEKASPMPSGLLVAAVLAIAFLLVLWWVRERRMSLQGRELRLLNQLVEEVIAAASPADILKKLNAALPLISEGGRAQLYLYNRGLRMLESVAASSAVQSVSIRPDAPQGAIQTGAALCLRNRTLLVVPDTRRDPFWQPDGEGNLPRSVMFVPMFAQSDLLGVLELSYADRLHYFSQEQQTAMQHLANQIATALRMQEQKSIREQLFRTEKLAAAGQLISGVAAELQSPLGSILELLALLRKRRGNGEDTELELIRAEVERATEIVARLISFGAVGHAEAQPVDINALLLGLLRFRAHERRQKGVEIMPQLLNQRVMVLGSQGQLEQVFLNLLVHAEQAAAAARDIAMSISSGLIGKRVLIEISYHTQSSEPRGKDPFTEADADAATPGLGLCRGIVQSHGGEIRLVRVSPTQSRFEVELPVMEASPQPIGAPGVEQAGKRQLTILLLEPDSSTQRQLVMLLSRRGHRVVPSGSAEEAADLALRLRFDLAISSTRLPGLSWVDFHQRVRQRIGAFILLTEGYVPDLARVFRAADGFVLQKPVDDSHLDRIMGLIEQRAEAGPGPED